MRMQKNIYFFVELAGKFNQETMEFQESQQQEWMEDNPGIGQEVLLSVYPTLLKFTPNHPFKACVSKGRALFKPVDYRSPNGEDQDGNVGWIPI